jgi:hypothetical protein
MLSEKLKSYIDSLSSIRFLGLKGFVVIGVYEHFASIVLFRSSINPLKILAIPKPSQCKIIAQRECVIFEDNYFELNREIKILADNHNLKNAVLVLLLNKYKHFNISLQKEMNDNDEESSIDDLIRKQLPANLNNNEFILHYEKISEDESLDNYLVTITRKQDIEKYLDIINNDAFQMKFALPSIFTIAKQKSIDDKVDTLIDFQKEKLVHYQLSNEGKISEDEYFFEPDNDYEKIVTEKLEQIIGNINPKAEEEIEKPIKLFIHTKLELMPVLSNAMLQLNSGREIGIAYDFGQTIKHQLAYKSLFNDTVFNFNLGKYFPPKQVFDIDRAITTRFVIASFSILLFMLVVLNSLNWIINNSLSDISMQNQYKKDLELQVKEVSERTEQLKSDIQSLNKIKYKSEKVSGLLKIISTASIQNLLLTDLILKRNNANKYEVKLSGESYSKDEVITYIKNLESNPELSNIELIWMDKKKEGAYQVQESIFDFQFSINMIYNENKNS